MLILFPKNKDGVKIALEIIHKEILEGTSFMFIMGMIYFAAKFGAITHAEQIALAEYLEEREGR